MNDNTTATNNEEPRYYVGIGASAGGLEALEELFTNMPEKSGLSFIVIQHLSPDYKSMMVELLSKKTALAVTRAEDNLRVEPDTIYLIPPRKNLTIFHGRLFLTDQDHSRGINLPIDVFLRSLAEDQGEKAIGIILSGTGSDGVRGIRALKETGGMVMVQAEDSARFDGMPRAAISTGLADFVLKPGEMPAKLQAFARHPHATRADAEPVLLSDEDGLARVFSLLRERTKVDFTFYKPSTVVRRIERRMTINQFEQLSDYVRYLQTHTGEIMLLYRELLINVTSFFRDREVFDELADKILQRVFTTPDKTEFRFWVAGCSTGEEAYSLAILCREAMETLDHRIDVKIFATDIDRDAVIQAGNGIYPESIAADVSPRYLTKYFIRQGENYRIDRTIREMVVFAQHNLLKDPPFTNIDLLSCRNLLIYLQPVLQRNVLDHFNFSLNPGGVLLLGSSETIGELTDCFDLLSAKHKLFASRGKRRTQPFGRDAISIPPIGRRQTMAIPRAGARALRATDDDRLLERLLQSLAGEFVPFAVVVNESHEVLHVLGDPKNYLGIPSGKLQNNVLKMATKDLAIPLATGLQKVFSTQEPVKYTNVRIRSGNETQTVELDLRPLPGRKGQEPLATVFIHEVSCTTRPAGNDTDVGQTYDANHEAEARIHDLEQELQFTRENLQATVEELETSNEELQATNEELLASNEELQSTNEELQSVNEELHTVNSEYQNKIMELTEVNNDLENLLVGTRVAVIFLDENLDIRRFSPEVASIFRIQHKDIGRPLFHLSHNLVGTDLPALIQQVRDNGGELEKEVEGPAGKWYLLRALPYKIGSGGHSGVSLTFIDITARRAAEMSSRQADQQYRLLFDHLFAGFALHEMIFDGTGKPADYRFLAVNPRFEELTGLRARDVVGKTVLEVMPTTEKSWIDLYGEVVLTGQPASFEQYSGALQRTFEVRAYRPEPGKFAVLFLDVSARKSTEAALRESEEQYRHLFETMTDGVVFQDASGRIIMANPSAERILGLSRDALTGMTSFDPNWQAIQEDGTPFPGSDHPAIVALRTGKTVRDVIMGIHNPTLGQTRWVSITAVPLFRHGNTTPEKVYAAFADVTESVAARLTAGRSSTRQG